jgi:hypothetical protein
LRFFFLLLSLPLLHASSILLNTNGGETPQTLGFTFGTYGQGVYVGKNTTLAQIGIWIGSPAGGPAEFQIWNGSNSTLLFSETQNVDAYSGTELLLSTPFSFALDAGNTYYFDVIGPYSSYGDQELGFIPGTSAETQHHLAPVWPNSVYLGANQPSGFAQGSFTLPIELIGTEGRNHGLSTDPPGGDPPDPPAAPEPGTLGMVALGCATAVAVKRSIR